MLRGVVVSFFRGLCSRSAYMVRSLAAPQASKGEEGVWFFRQPDEREVSPVVPLAW